MQIYMKSIESSYFYISTTYKGKLFADITENANINLWAIIQVFAQIPKFNYLKQLGKACYCKKLLILVHLYIVNYK